MQHAASHSQPLKPVADSISSYRQPQLYLTYLLWKSMRKQRVIMFQDVLPSYFIRLRAYATWEWQLSQQRLCCNTHTHTRDIHVTNSLHENETGKQEIEGVRPRQAKENLWQGCRKRFVKLANYATQMPRTVGNGENRLKMLHNNHKSRV